MNHASTKLPHDPQPQNDELAPTKMRIRIRLQIQKLSKESWSTKSETIYHINSETSGRSSIRLTAWPQVTLGMKQQPASTGGKHLNPPAKLRKHHEFTSREVQRQHQRRSCACSCGPTTPHSNIYCKTAKASNSMYTNTRVCIKSPFHANIMAKILPPNRQKHA